MKIFNHPADILVGSFNPSDRVWVRCRGCKEPQEVSCLVVYVLCEVCHAEMCKERPRWRRGQRALRVRPPQEQEPLQRPTPEREVLDSVSDLRLQSVQAK